MNASHCNPRLALTPGITFLGLGLAHFNPVGANSPAALLTFTGFYVTVPACLGIVTTIIVSGYKLTTERHAEICRKLSAVEFK